MAEDRIFVLDCGYMETMLQMQNRVTVCFYLAQTFLLTILTHLFCSSIFVFFHFLKRLGEQLSLPLELDSHFPLCII